MTLTIGIIAPGAMGSATAARLARHGATVLTSLEGRSDVSRERARAADMHDVDEGEIVERSDIILSIVPPSEAEALAARFAGAIHAARRAPVFCDCNAVSVSTVVRIGALLDAAGAPFVDGGIIGAPPKADGPGPTFYLSGDAEFVAEKLASHGLDARRIEGPVGAATALKLSYAGVTKGLAAIGATMILAAERAGAGEALRAELGASQPQLLARFEKSLPDMFPKAYRWVEEMNAISDFIGDDRAEAAIFKGAAGLYERIAADVAAEGAECARITSFLLGDAASGEGSKQSAGGR